MSAVRRPSPGTVIACAALFFAAGGDAFAQDAVTAATRTIHGKTIKKGTVTSKQVRDRSITSRDIKPGTLGADRLSPAARLSLRGLTGPSGPAGPPGPPGSNATLDGVSAGGALTGTFPAPSLADDAVTAPKIAADQVGPSELVDNLANTLGLDDIGTGAVDSNELADDLDDTINADDLSSESVGVLELQDDLNDSLGTDDLGAGSVDSSELSDDLDDTVDKDDIATDGVGSAEVDDGTLRTEDTTTGGGSVLFEDQHVGAIPAGTCRVAHTSPANANRRAGSLAFWVSNAQNPLDDGLETMPVVVGQSTELPVWICNRTAGAIDPGGFQVDERRFSPSA